MDRWQIQEALDRATEAVTGSHMARRYARLSREAWRAWRAQWNALEVLPPTERLLVVCMYCERFRDVTGDWMLAPTELAEMLHDRTVVQLTHGACPLCLAAHLDEVPG
jgi:broad specificity phosphatase PhoE